MPKKITIRNVKLNNPKKDLIAAIKSTGIKGLSAIKNIKQANNMILFLRKNLKDLKTEARKLGFNGYSRMNKKVLQSTLYKNYRNQIINPIEVNEKEIKMNKYKKRLEEENRKKVFPSDEELEILRLKVLNSIKEQLEDPKFWTGKNIIEPINYHDGNETNSVFYKMFGVSLETDDNGEYEDLVGLSDDYIMKLKQFIKKMSDEENDYYVRKYTEERNKFLTPTFNEIRERLLEFLNSNGEQLDLKVEFYKNKNHIFYSDILRILLENIKLYEDNKYTIKVISQAENQPSKTIYFTLNTNTIERLLESLKESTKQTEGDLGSDPSTGTVKISDIKELILQKYIPNIKKKDGTVKKKLDGAFFNKYNNTKINLERYGIFNKDNFEGYNTNCFIDALEKLGCSEFIVDQIKLSLLNNNLPLCKLKEIAEEYKITLHVNVNEKVKKYGNTGPIYKLALINNHYFIYEVYTFKNTNNEEKKLSFYALKNYFKLAKDYDLEVFCEFERNPKKAQYGKFKPLTSLDIIRYMNKNEGYFTYMENDTLLQTTVNYKKVCDKITNIEYDKDICTKKNEYIPKNNTCLFDKTDPNIKKYDTIFADFETHQNNQTEHVEDLLCAEYEYPNGDIVKRSFIGPKCGKTFLESLKNDSLIIFHNSSYDFTFLLKYLYGDNVVMKGKKLIIGKFLYKNEHNGQTYNIVIKDSAALIPRKLADFKYLFHLEVEKEVISHKYYNNLFNDNEKLQYQKIERALNYLSEEEKPLFLENIKKWNLQINEEYYNAMGYRVKYCEMDCTVLRKGYSIFKKDIQTITGLNCDYYPTLASLIDSFLLKEGVYNEVYKLSGTPRHFIQKCCVGGRTMSNSNKKYHIKGKIYDFDAVSLYPSAMSRLDGYLKGIPKVIPQKNLNYNILKNYDGYFVEINITKVGKNRQFPLLSYIADDGNRLWTNDMAGKNIFVDKISLEDLIEFHNIEFNVIRGYYFNDGFNTKIKDVITTLFNKRAEEKANGNQIQEIYKLLMNSAYGKTILKPIEKDIKIVTGKDNKKKEIIYNYNSIIEVHKIKNCKKYVVHKLKPINNHFNNVHCGVSVLSMSKRIMNEVMCLAEDIDLKIYYQDTDSMHVNDQTNKEGYTSAISVLNDEYIKKYNRELIGTSMGQFHSDFEIKGFKGDVYSIELIVLGKKCYLDVLEGINSEGNKVHGYHTRMKAIPPDAIDYTCEKHNLKTEELYLNMYNGQAYKFDLRCGGKKDIFKFDKNSLSYSMFAEFERTLKF